MNLRENIKKELGLLTEQAANARNITYKTCQGSTISGQANITTQGQVPQIGDILRINTNQTGYGTPRTVMVLGVSPNNATNQQLQNAQCQPNCPNCNAPCFNWTTMQSCNGTTGDPDCVVSGNSGWPGGTPTIECGSCGCGGGSGPVGPLGPNTYWCMSNGTTGCEPWSTYPANGTMNGGTQWVGAINMYGNQAACDAGPCGTSTTTCDTTPASACATQWFGNNASNFTTWMASKDCSNYQSVVNQLEPQANTIMAGAPNLPTIPYTYNNWNDIKNAANTSGLVNPQKGQFKRKMAKAMYAQCQITDCNC